MYYDPFTGCAAGWCGCMFFILMVIVFGLIIGVALGA